MKDIAAVEVKNKKHLFCMLRQLENETDVKWDGGQGPVKGGKVLLVKPNYLWFNWRGRQELTNSRKPDNDIEGFLVGTIEEFIAIVNMDKRSNE